MEDIKKFIELNYPEIVEVTGSNYVFSPDQVVKIVNDYLEERRSEFLLDFANHLNSYNGLEEIRFDWMVIDYIKKFK